MQFGEEEGAVWLPDPFVCLFVLLLICVCVEVHTCIYLCVYAHVCGSCMHIHGEAGNTLGDSYQEHLSSLGRHGLSLAWGSPIRLGWSASEPQNPTISNSPGLLVLVHATTPSIFIWVLGLNPGPQAFGKTLFRLIHFPSPLYLLWCYTVTTNPWHRPSH